jgi:hypothetical protein
MSSRRRFATPADSPLQDCSPYRGLHAHRESNSLKAHSLCAPRQNPIPSDSRHWDTAGLRRHTQGAWEERESEAGSTLTQTPCGAQKPGWKQLPSSSSSLPSSLALGCSLSHFCLPWERAWASARSALASAATPHAICSVLCGTVALLLLPPRLAAAGLVRRHTGSFSTSRACFGTPLCRQCLPL